MLLFLVTIDFVLVCAFAYCWGGGLVQFLGQNLSLKFYNGVLNLYVPGVLGAQEEGIPNIYRDVTASVSGNCTKRAAAVVCITGGKPGVV